MKFSDLLLVYFGMSVDILDFLTQGIFIFGCDVSGSQIVLVITAVSLVQFTLDIELMLDKFDRIHRSQSIFTLLGIQEIMKYPEVRTIVMNMLMQDLPFLVLRIYILFFADDKITGEKPTFFAVKNVMVLSLQSYRLYILIKKDEGSIKLRKSLKKKAIPAAEDEEGPDKSEEDADTADAVTVMMEPMGNTKSETTENMEAKI